MTGWTSRVSCVFAVALLSAGGAQAQGVPTPPVVAISFELPPGVEVAEVAPLLDLEVGAPLSRRAVRRSVRILYESRRWRQVRVYARPQGRGVHLSFALDPEARVHSVGVTGLTRVSEGRALGWVGLGLGERYTPARAEAGAARLTQQLRRFGHLQAEVEPQAQTHPDGRVQVVFQVREGPRAPLRSVLLSGRDGRAPAPISLIEAMGLRVGDFFELGEEEQLRARVLQALKAQGYLEARVGRLEAEPDPAGGAALVVPLEAGPVVTVRFVGNRWISAQRLEAALELPQDEAVGPEDLSAGAQRLTRLYRGRGFPWAEVRGARVSGRGDTAELRFTVQEGPFEPVAGLTFPGAWALDARELEEAICDSLATRAPPPPARVTEERLRHFGGWRGRPSRDLTLPRLGPCEIFDADGYALAREVLMDRYGQRGYLSVQVGEPRLRRDTRGRVWVEIPVEEGVQVVVSAVEFEGVSSLEPPRLLALVPITPAGPLPYRAVEEGRLALLGAYAEAGYPFAAVEAEVELDASRTSATVRYRAQEGPQVRVGRLLVRGLNRTEEALVRARLTLGPGALWRRSAIQESQASLLDLGIYRGATLSLLNRDEPAEEMDAVVTVNERRPMALELGFGVSTEDGPRTVARFDHLAFWWNSELAARAKANYPVFDLDETGLVSSGPEWQVHLGLRFPTALDARTDLIFERDYRPVYGLTRLAWSVGGARSWWGALTGSLKAELEFDDIHRDLDRLRGAVLTQQDLERLRLEEGQTLLVSVRPNLSLDLRDDRLNPRSGFFGALNLDWSHDLGVGSPIHLLRAFGAASIYVPASRRATLALSARGGHIFQLPGGSAVAIGPKRFYLGGADSLRGFPVDSVYPEDRRQALGESVIACRNTLSDELCPPTVRPIAEGERATSNGGQTYLLLKSELRFPLTAAVEGGVFVDAGNLWLEPERAQLIALRASVGAGLRLQTPVGPVALDLGVNLDPDPLLNEKIWDFHLRIGVF